MAKNKGVNKTQAIKEAIAAGITKPTDVVEHLAKQGIKLSAQYVSTIKSLSKRRVPGRSFTMEELDQVPAGHMRKAREIANAEFEGDLGKLREALEALEMLQ